MAESEDPKKQTFWGRVAHRFSGRGRIRSVFFIASLIFCGWNPVCAGIGLAVFVIGMILHAVSKGNLVRNKQLCTGGPYGWVRHPFYAANFVIDLSLCLMCGAPLVAAVYVVAFPLAYLPRIFAEEEMLRGYFGPVFDEYCRTTPRLFPRSIPRLIAWLRSSTFENMRLENELSRLIRLAAYPFFIAAGILVKRWYFEHDAHPSLLAACAAMALALWAAGQLLHRHLEDGKPVRSPGLAHALVYGWLLAPLLPLLQDRVPLLRIAEADAQLRLVGKILLGVAAVMLVISLLTKKSRSEGFSLTLLALSCGLAAGQAVLAPIFALLIWSGWFLLTLVAEAPPSAAAPATSYPRPMAFIAMAAFMISFIATGF